jgi:hypothetical protein
MSETAFVCSKPDIPVSASFGRSSQQASTAQAQSGAKTEEMAQLRGFLSSTAVPCGPDNPKPKQTAYAFILW